MKPRTLLCALALLLLAGCGAAPQGIPEGLTWTARTLQSQETGAILAAAEKTSIQDVPRLDLTAQVEGGTITLTDHASGETYTGTLSPAEDAAPNAQIYTLVFPDQPEGYGVYGVTEYSDGSRDATLYLTINAQTLCLTAPLSET
mgnify:FL=1